MQPKCVFTDVFMIVYVFKRDARNKKLLKSETR